MERSAGSTRTKAVGFWKVAMTNTLPLPLPLNLPRHPERSTFRSAQGAQSKDPVQMRDGVIRNKDTISGEYCGLRRELQLDGILRLRRFAPPLRMTGNFSRLSPLALTA